jgi:hypothetical protein
VTTIDPTLKARIVLGTAFTGAGIAHVVKHEWFEQLVPEPLFRWRKPISAITAVIQFVGGISMFIPRLRTVAGRISRCWCRPCQRRWTRSIIPRCCARLASLHSWHLFAWLYKPSWPR